MQRYYPSLKDIIFTALATIRNHPNIVDPIVKSPVADQFGNFPTIPIVKYRNFDGIELPEGGLTLSIFPRYSPGDHPYGGDAATFNPVTLGNKGLGAMYEVTYHLVVSLAYQDVALGNITQLSYVRSNNKDYYSSADKKKVQESTGDFPIIEESFEIEINTAEDILRDYIEVIRFILESIERYVPWALRGNSVTSIGFPSSSWERDNPQIFFHKAYLQWDITTYSPTQFPVDPALVREIIINYLINTPLATGRHN